MESKRVRRHLAECESCRVRESEMLAANEKLFQQLREAHQMEPTPAPSAKSPRPEYLSDDLSATVDAGTSIDSGRVKGTVPADFEIEGYEIRKEIGGGGQGVVFLAFQKGAKRHVAIKLLQKRGNASESARKRFQREIEVVAQFNHPNIVTVFHPGLTSDGRQFVVMDYIRGQKLNDFLRRQHCSLEETLKLFRTVCQAVDYAHSQNVIHCDLKPSNILVDEEGNPKILDFGLAKRTEEPADSLVTQHIMGTPAYMSPEQAQGRPLDARTDVYSLGVILNQLLTGGSPYPVDGSNSEVLRHIVETDPSPLRQRWSAEQGVPPRSDGKTHPSKCPIDKDVETIVITALHKETDDRYQSAGLLADDIDRYFQGKPIRPRRKNPFYVAWKEFGQAVARFPKASHLVVLALVYLIAHTLYVSGVFRPLDRRFESLVQWLNPAVWPDELVVVALDDATYDDVERLASDLELNGVSAKNLFSWRRLHGALMRRLAGARPKVVAWDIKFASTQPRYDPDFIKGVSALQEVDSRVIVGYADVDEERHLALSPAIAEVVDARGWIQIHEEGGVVNGALLLVNHPPHPPTPSLSLATFAASRFPDFQPVYEWETMSTMIRIRYNSPDSKRPLTSWVPEPDTIMATNVTSGFAIGLPPGMDPENRTAASEIVVISEPEVLKRHTLTYRSVFDMTETELQERFRGKTILIGDTRLNRTKKPDRKRVDDGMGGREEFSCYVHAAVIAQLMKTGHRGERGITRAGWVVERFSILFAGSCGVLIGMRNRGRLARLRFWIMCLVG
ncbi:MAG: protein kinase, partial [Planctomycetota bacterium]|nr:protein kinase [Planctomycetota bacterium]